MGIQLSRLVARPVRIDLAYGNLVFSLRYNNNLMVSLRYATALELENEDQDNAVQDHAVQDQQQAEGQEEEEGQAQDGEEEEGKEGRKGRERRRQRCSLAHLQEKEKENEESKTKENRKGYKNINKKSFYQNNPVYKKLKKCCDKTKYQGICDISQSELSNRCHNSEHTPHTPLTSPLTPFNGSINENENESMEPCQSTCVTSDNSVKIFAENRNKENNTVQDDIHEYPSNGENFDNRISPKFFYSHVMLYTHVVKQCLQMISSVLVTKNMFRRYLSFVYCNLVAIMKCCFEMFS